MTRRGGWRPSPEMPAGRPARARPGDPGRPAGIRPPERDKRTRRVDRPQHLHRNILTPALSESKGAFSPAAQLYTVRRWNPEERHDRSALLACCRPRRCANDDGDISGLITDPQKAALNGRHRSRDEHGNGTHAREPRADQSGVYRLAGLQIGTYEVVAVLPGLRSYTARVQLNIGRDVTLDIDDAGRGPRGRCHGPGRRSARLHPLVGRRRSRRSGPHSGAAAERTAVRQPRGDRPRRRTRVPFGLHQVGPVQSADQRRQRPQHQLHRRRWRQQRRHRRRPAAAVSARSDPGIHGAHAALRRRVRPQQRRRAECGDEERHEPASRQLVHAGARRRR